MGEGGGAATVFLGAQVNPSSGDTQEMYAEVVVGLGEVPGPLVSVASLEFPSLVELRIRHPP